MGQGRSVAGCRCALVLLACGSASSPLVAQESASFVAERLTLVVTGDSASSSNFDTVVTFAQEGPVGSVSICNDGMLPTSGFWSIRGGTFVPIFLEASRNPADPEQVDLMWSGAVPLFDVYRAEEPEDVAIPMHLLLTTSSCSLSDVPPGGSDIFYYLISPSAGGGAP